MAAAFLRPGCLAGPGQADDRYLTLVQSHGDSSDAPAQVAALADLGIRARFRQDGRIVSVAVTIAVGANKAGRREIGRAHV
jgi:hypothetical protein